MLLENILLEMSYTEAFDFVKRHDKTFPDNFTPEMINQYRRRLAKKFHPDLGGDTTTLRDLNRALDILKKPNYYRPDYEQYRQHGYNTDQSNEETDNFENIFRKHTADLDFISIKELLDTNNDFDPSYKNNELLNGIVKAISRLPENSFQKFDGVRVIIFLLSKYPSVRKNKIKLPESLYERLKDKRAMALIKWTKAFSWASGGNVYINYNTK